MIDVFAHPMAHLWIALQAGIPTLVVGMPGCGKTLLHAALARAMGRRFVPLCGSQCTPEDVGGLPVPDLVAKLCRMLPLSWVEALLTPGGFLFLDEFLTVSPAVQAAMLTVIQDKRVGEHHLDVDTLIAAACNPLEHTPNGTPLTLPTANRFFHAKWETDRAAWLDGLIDCEWTAPAMPLVPAEFKTLVPKWGSMVQSFLRRTGGELDNVPPQDDTTWAYPTERTWRNSILCLAAADAAGADLTTDNSFVRKLMAGNVGRVATDQFVAFKQTLDLVDPIDLLDGNATFEHRDDRPDITLTVAAAVTSTVCLPGTFTPDRWDAAAKFLGEIGTTASPEIALRYTGTLKKGAIANKYSPKPAALKPLVELGAMLVIPSAT
jgi:hypothetical protein